MFVLSPGLVWNPDYLKEAVTGSSHTPEARVMHPSILDNRCMRPSIFLLDSSIRLFYLIFLVNGQTLHPSIAISNKGTVPLVCIFQ